jgi:hypothetical protein
LTLSTSRAATSTTYLDKNTGTLLGRGRGFMKKTLEYDPSKLCAENIFTETCPPYLTDLRAYLRGHNYLAIYTQGSPKPESYFQDLEAQFQQDKEKDPALAWYADAVRPVIQRGMYLEPNERPLMTHVPAVYTSSNWLDYMTRHGYACIYENEHQKTILDPFI